MNKLTAFLLIAIMALSFVLGTTLQSKAQNKNFVGILPFMTSGDRVGFLDQNNGRIYLYDSNVSQCLFVGQIQALGKPIQPITVNPTNP
jgi:hypothetical protein